ncbi:MAG: serine hydrolase [Candidatus Saccharimonadales bacterium]
MVKKLLATFVAVVLVVEIVALVRPAPKIMPAVLQPQPAAAVAVDLPWPTYGQAALGAQGHGLLQTNGQQAPVPIASVTKLITALAILEKKPLAINRPGPSITLDQADLDSFNYYYLNDGSVSAVKAGETITLQQALSALLVPSSNNMADSLTRWAFGSPQAYLDYANQMVKKLNMKQTTVKSASGFSNETTSTATDLVTLGQAVLANPVLADIVSKKNVTIPAGGMVNSTNWLLGVDNIIGIKTGNTDMAGGCYLFAAKRPIHGQEITLIGAVLSAPQLTVAMRDSQGLIRSASQAFSLVKPVASGQVLGQYRTPWGTSVKAVGSKDVSLLVWQGRTPNVTVDIDTVRPPAKAGRAVGTATAAAGSQSSTVPVILKDDLPGPAISWRLWH